MSTMTEDVWTISVDGGAPTELIDWELERRQDNIQGETGGHFEPDPEWSAVDSSGHKHRWKQDGDRWKVSKSVKIMVPCDGACGDPGHRVPVWRCSKCGVEIEPGTKYVGPRSVTIPGMKSATLTVRAETLPSVDVAHVVIHRNGERHLSGRVRALDWRTFLSESSLKLDFRPDPENSR